MEATNQGPKGLGGWLILPAVGLIITPIYLLADFVKTFVPFFRDGYWEVLTTPGSEAYHWLWGPTIVFEIVSNTLMAVAALFLLALYFQKSHRFPIWFIVYLAARVVIQALDLFAAHHLSNVAGGFIVEGAGELARSVLASFVWIPYMLVSKRVKNTFVKPTELKAPSPPTGTTASPIEPQ